MRAVNIKEAKAHLNELVEAASRGEEVVLMRGSKHVAALVPITDADVELAPRLADEQAERLWRQVAQERAAGTLATFASAEEAVAHLSRAPRPRARAPKPRFPVRRIKAGSR
jgi:prevent-host-death family protein